MGSATARERIREFIDNLANVVRDVYELRDETFDQIADWEMKGNYSQAEIEDMKDEARYRLRKRGHPSP
jgi:hypothetical protein